MVTLHPYLKVPDPSIGITHEHEGRRAAAVQGPHAGADAHTGRDRDSRTDAHCARVEAAKHLPAHDIPALYITQKKIHTSVATVLVLYASRWLQ